jgi:predicted Abi (CAAX) family protease
MFLDIQDIQNYLHKNLIAGFCTSPLRAPFKAVALAPLYVLAAIVIGFGADLLHYEPVSHRIAPLLPFTLFIFPALVEEAFFRGILIPRNMLNRGCGATSIAIAGSTLLFVMWHPLSAFTMNPAAKADSLNPAFLSIVALLGVTCGYSYVASRSLWVPVLIHWVTVIIWVLWLGGRNLLLEL